MTNWEKYFGTPERASKMFVAFPASMLSLDRCYVSYEPENGAVGEFLGSFRDQAALLEWLESEADNG